MHVWRWENSRLHFLVQTQPPSNPEWTRTHCLVSELLTAGRVQVTHQGGLFLLAQAKSSLTGQFMGTHAMLMPTCPTEQSPEPTFLVPTMNAVIVLKCTRNPRTWAPGPHSPLILLPTDLLPSTFAIALLKDPAVFSSQSYNFLICKIPTCQVVSHPPLRHFLHPYSLLCSHICYLGQVFSSPAWVSSFTGQPPFIQHTQGCLHLPKAQS